MDVFKISLKLPVLYMIMSNIKHNKQTFKDKYMGQICFLKYFVKDVFFMFHPCLNMYMAALCDYNSLDNQFI